MKNNSLSEIGSLINKSEKILLYPHIHMDGDAIGSAIALCIAIRNMGKQCYVVIEDDIPMNLAFLDRGYCTFDTEILGKADLQMTIDCGSLDRLIKRVGKFQEGPVTVCIDHHATTVPYCDYNFVDSKASATAEIIYKLLMVMKQPLNQEIAKAIFAGITTDCGNFQYSNTTRETHEIVAALYDTGADFNEVSIEIYENMRMEKILIKNRALANMTILCGGKGAIAYVTQKMLEETGATMDETDWIINEMRSINGVEVAAFLKEEAKDRTKVSLRSKHDADVSVIAAAKGGGGHAKAAGFTIHSDLTAAFDEVVKDITEVLEKL